MIPKTMTKKSIVVIFAVAALWIYSCTTSEQFVSQQSVEDKVARIKLGVATMSEVEAILGTDHGNERYHWVYSLADTSSGLIERQQSGRLSGVLPVTVGTAPTNTRAVITVRFTDKGIVKGLDVSRFFNAPFTNDYFYMVKESAQNILESVARIGESSEFQIVSLDKAAGSLTMDDLGKKARIRVALENRILRMTSSHSYDRLSNEYRVFSKREVAFTEKLSQSEFIQ